MPVGKVKWFDVDKGFGFASNPGDDDVYIHRDVLPPGVEELHKGQRVEFDFASGRRGPQALRLRLIDPPHTRRKRRPASELSSMVLDLISLLDGVQPGLAAGRYPDRKTGRQVAQILRAVADDLDA
ncbi:cold-shock protein [Corynebacterium atypicum]|uniref:Cold-shock protein n=1 Tax=Corynebacterium atypicum TaxID=191610 RepID=A0ABM5QM16_9CORY|nr:cold-shock protein [Corynebacterium atypicum]AIG63837.1 cold-shock protein [Corynebacterium atypicum]